MFANTVLDRQRFVYAEMHKRSDLYYTDVLKGRAEALN